MNLLPQTEKHLIKQGLRARSVIVAALLVSAAMVIGSVMLLPSYFLTRAQLSMMISDGSASKSENAELTKAYLSLPNEIEAKLEFIEADTSQIKIIGSLSKIISYLPEGVRLESVALKRQSEKSKQANPSIVVSIAGVSKTREALVGFSESLNKSEDFESVEVPVGSLTREKDLPFSMNITVVPTKNNKNE